MGEIGLPRLVLTVPPEADGLRAADYLRRAAHLSGANLRQLRDRGGLCLDGAEIPGYTPLRAGGILSADLSDPPAAEPVSAGELPMVLYADAWFALVDKPAGLATHASTFQPGVETMHNRMAALWGEDIIYHPVNRLDRHTSGVMCVARCAYMHERMKSLLHTDGFVRSYLALCRGRPKEDSGSVELPIGREEGSLLRRRTGVGQYARTDYRVLCANGEASLVLALPRTGRTHQIRVHMQALGCPLLGDFLYGDETAFPRTALHSAAVSLCHPITGERLKISAPLPEDMKTYLSSNGLNFNDREDLLHV